MNELSQNELDRLLKTASVSAGMGDARYALRLDMRRGCLFLCITGKLIQPVLPDDFTDAFSQLVSTKDGKGVIIDLRGCDYLSSGAIGYIVQFFHTATERGGQVIILKPIEKVRRLIDILGLGHYFLIVDDEDTAVAFYRAQEAARRADEESGTRPPPG